MLENFHLVAIAKTGPNVTLYHIPLHQQLQNQLAREWTSQRDGFLDDVEEVGFDAGYTPEDNERFVLENYDPPEWLADETSQTVGDLESVTAHEEQIESIKGIAAFARDENGNEVVLFQNFSRAHVIKPGRFLFLRDDTYQTAPRPGLTLDGKLAAMFLPREQKLLFSSFRTTNTFLPLASFYEEASEEQIRDVLGHQRVAAEDVDALAVGANQWFRKRWAMLRDSGILDSYTAQQIEQHAQGYDVSIVRRGNRIVFPAEKREARRLLQFLNEEIFRGAITDTLYETNSKREAD